MPDVSFFTTPERFSNTPAPDAINEMRGKDVGEWLQAKIKEAGLDYDFMGEMIAEDYGYGFWLNVEGVPYWITQTQLHPADPPDEPLPKWLIGVEGRAGCVWLFRRQPQPVHLGTIAAIVHEALTADEAVSGVEWWRSSYGSGTPTATPP